MKKTIMRFSQPDKQATIPIPAYNQSKKLNILFRDLKNRQKRFAIGVAILDWFLSWFPEDG